MVLRSDQRVLFIGRTGSGKTYLAERLTAPLQRLIIVDPNDTLANRFLPHTTLKRGWDALVEGRAARIRVSFDTPDAYEDFFTQVYQEVQQAVIYIDELYAVVNQARPGRGIWNLYTRGRGRGLGVWASTQRPRHIPRIALSESDWFFVFDLTLPDDRAYLASFIHESLGQSVKHEHGFYYWNIRWPKPYYSRPIS